IQDAIDAASAGDEILVTNGVYATGGRVIYGVLTNRVAVTKPLTLRSVNGAGGTGVQGYQMPGTTNGDNDVRCGYITKGGALIGFTLTNGATRNTGDFLTEQIGGGVSSESSSSVVSNCALAGNSASSGGGAYSGTLNNCMFKSNTSQNTGGATYGGTLNNCI